MGHRNDDTIEDTRARKYSKIPTNPKPPKDQKNPADWRSLQRKSLFTSRILAIQEHNTTAPKKLLCRIESCDRLRLESGLYKCSECVPSELEELTPSSLETIDYKRDLDRYTTQSVLRSTLTLQTADCQPAHRDRHSKGLTACGPATAPSTSPGLCFQEFRDPPPRDATIGGSTPCVNRDIDE